MTLTPKSDRINIAKLKCNTSVVKNLPAMQETQEMQVQFLHQENPLEEEMATHSSILAWKIPWAEEAGRLQSKRSRVGPNWGCVHICMHECIHLWTCVHLWHRYKNANQSIIEQNLGSYKKYYWTSLAVQRLRLCTSNVGGKGSIHGQGTKIPHAVWHGHKEKKRKKNF